jgi:hypothetical protein
VNYEDEVTYWRQVIRPGLSLLTSLPEAWYVVPTLTEGEEAITSMVSSANSLRACLGRYVNRFGHLPLAAPLSAGACVRRWVELRGGADTAWMEVWGWATEILDPIRRYHAAQVFLECPQLVPEASREGAWQAVTDVLSWVRPQEELADPYSAGWEVRAELARHYLGHLELHALDQPGDKLAALAWWVACRVADLLLPPPTVGSDPTSYLKAIREGLEQAVRPAADITNVMWTLARPAAAITPFSFGTMVTRHLFGASLLLSPESSRIGAPEVLDIRPTAAVEAVMESVLLGACISGFPPEPESAGARSLWFAIEESVVVAGRAWLTRFQTQERKTELEIRLVARESLARGGELVAVLGRLLEEEQFVQVAVACTFHTLSALGGTDEEQAWGFLQDPKRTASIFSRIDQHAVPSLCWGFIEIQRRAGGRWHWFLPQVFTHLATLRDLEPQRQRLLALMALRAGVVGGCLGAIRGLLIGARGAEFREHFEEWRTQLAGVSRYAPQHIAGILRDVIAHLTH